MFFIGIISEHQKFDKLLEMMQEYLNKNEVTLININKKSVENLKNVKFDTIVLIDYIEKMERKTNNLIEMYKNVKYLIINSDFEIKSDILPEIKTNIITYGLNHKSTVTFSSITDEMMLISVQRDFESKKGKVIEVGEYGLKIDKEQRVYLYEILVSFIIKKIYNI